MSVAEQEPVASTWDVPKAALEKQNISIMPGKNVPFSRTNIVIGMNGSGKTRLLKAIKEKYKNDGDKDILYGYFPSLSSDRESINTQTLPEFSLEEFLDSDDVNFNDFFKEIEVQHDSFFKNLLQPVSTNKRKKYDRILQAVSDVFSSFTGKTLERGNVVSRKFRFASKRKVDTLTQPAIMVRDPHRGTSISLEQALSEFSPGERMLFYMSLFFVLKKEPSREHMQVIILDEPEAHLHPDALIKFVTDLVEQFPKACIWIATHSLFLLPLFKFENIVYMENSQIIPRSGNLYTKILSSMLGPHRENVQSFFTSLPQWQYCGFIAECFNDPGSVNVVDPADPQADIFIQAMQSRNIKKVLDYGGGNGRLGRNVSAAKVHEWENIEYHILDKEKQDVGDGIKVIDDLKDADSDYDCVVMMNFLHEVEPTEWPEIFSKLYPRVTPLGFLLFVEVGALRNGEYPNDAGYFLLEADELKTVFSLNARPTEIVDRKTGKHHGFLIPRSALQSVNENSVASAIKDLESRTYQEIRMLRARGQKQSNFRKYAFLLQQHMNAMLYNEKVEKARKKF